ncbi:MAG: SUMF1/EgtB/PvdO family nonheme iron enzyme [Nitrospinota bacterium]|nr:SUMF1/EgtB/PvdO family nonheme iron enzyme [Nitrospinota bacterium]
MKYIFPAWILLITGLMTTFTGFALAGEVDLLQSGQKAFSEGKYKEAEEYFSQVVAQAPDDHKALRSLAETKIKLKNFQEAETLIDRILKMPVVKGRNVLIYVEGDPNPHEAELVDETVMVKDESAAAAAEKEQSESFIRADVEKRVPHYRVYFMKTGKMKLLPKSKTRVQYKGIPTATRDLALALKAEVQKSLISTQHSRADEEMVEIPAGCFQMGSGQGEPDERPVHKVCISAFQMGKYEVQQKNFQAVMASNPSQHVGADLPVDSLTWDEASDYCKKIGMRLPTEAEWEYAARAGTTTPFYWGATLSGKEANFCDSTCKLNIREPRVTDGFNHTAPVGSFPPNPFGLYDMAGNVSEWVQDWMGAEKNYYLISPEKDPPGPRPDLQACMRVDCIGSLSITNKVYRGGAWNENAGALRSANRRDSHFQLRPEGTGFRCAKSSQ